jgi:putative oxidoreductase
MMTISTNPVKALEPITGDAYTKHDVRIWLAAVEQRAVEMVQRISLPTLRVAMGLVFLWFGALKMADATPVGDLVAHTVPFIDRHVLVPGMGVLEVALGVGLLVGWPYRIILPTMIGHLSGTFLVLVVQPNVAFQHGNLLLLTTTGEFVVKNLVLISAAMVLLARTARRQGCRTGAASNP